MYLTLEERADVNQRSNVKAFSILCIAMVFYAVALVGTLMSVSSLLPFNSVVADILFNCVSAVFLGMAIGMFFLVGHDACHQCYTTSKKLDSIIGRIALFPTYVGYSLWDVCHNKLHHGFTNIQEKDTAWVPLSPEQYQALSPFKRWVERFMRGPLGIVVYYPIRVWGPRLVLPLTPETKKSWRKHRLDSVLALASLVVMPLGILHVGNWLGVQTSASYQLLISYVLPMIVWWVLFTTTIFFHHTHPSIPWYRLKDRKNISFDALNFQCTTRTDIPRALSLFYINIMEHTVHHLAPASAPMYNLKKSQRKLEERYPGQILTFRHGIKEYWDIMKRCKLFDFERNCWTDFNGTPTGPMIPKLKAVSKA